MRVDLALRLIIRFWSQIALQGSLAWTLVITTLVHPPWYYPCYTTLGTPSLHGTELATPLTLDHGPNLVMGLTYFQ